MINKPVVNHLCPPAPLASSCPALFRARPAAGYLSLRPFSASLRARPDPPHPLFSLAAARAMNFAGIAVLTEPDASRASYNWVHYVHRRESRRHASVGNYRNLSSARCHPLLREEGRPLRFSAERPGHRVSRTTLVIASSFPPSSCCSSCRLIDDASFYELNPP